MDMLDAEYEANLNREWQNGYDSAKKELAAALLQNDELREDVAHYQQVLVDFAREEFGDDEGKTWEAPFTAGKFIEMVRDEMRKQHRLSGDLKTLSGKLAQKVHDVAGHFGSFPFCMQEPCREAFEALYRKDEVKRNVSRTALEQYLAVSMQMLMAREDKRDDIPYLDKLDGIYALLMQDERDFCNEMGGDWSKHHKGRGCPKCRQRSLPDKCDSSNPCR